MHKYTENDCNNIRKMMEGNKTFETAYKTLLPILGARGFKDKDALDAAYNSRDPRRMRELLWHEIGILLDLYRTI